MAITSARIWLGDNRAIMQRTGEEWATVFMVKKTGSLAFLSETETLSDAMRECAIVDSAWHEHYYERLDAVYNALNEQPED